MGEKRRIEEVWEEERGEEERRYGRKRREEDRGDMGGREERRIEEIWEEERGEEDRGGRESVAVQGVGVAGAGTVATTL